jgi:hypothetical protein
MSAWIEKKEWDQAVVWNENEKSVDDTAANAIDDTEWQQVITKTTDSWSYLVKVFNINWPVWNKLWWILSKIKLIPYYIFSWFIWLCWILLVPKWTIMFIWKLWLPLIFWTLIISLFLISWTHVALPSIDNMLFWNQFYPLLWYWIWWFFLITFFTTFIIFYRTWKTSWKVNEFYSNHQIMFWWIIIAVAVSFLWWIWNFIITWNFNSNNLFIIAQNCFWFLIYFFYVYLLINLLMMLYKKIIYIVFSVLNKETQKIWWHLLSIAIYLIIIFLINWFLEISLITIW